MNPLTRRDLLAAGVGLTLTPLVARAQKLAPSSPKSFSFAFFGGTDVDDPADGAVEAARLAGLATRFTEMGGLPVAFALHGGDVTAHGAMGEYAAYRKLRARLSVPIRHVPGVHDLERAPYGLRAFRAGTGDPAYQAFEFSGVRFFLLDSTVPGSTDGHLDGEQLRWLVASLSEAGTEVPIVLVAHHGIEGPDGLDNAGDLARIVEPYNVKLLLSARSPGPLPTWNGIVQSAPPGLREGGWLRANVDLGAGEIRLTTHGEGSIVPPSVVSVSLAAEKRSRRWLLPEEIPEGSLLEPSLPGAREYRWDDGRWTRLPARGIPTAGLPPGVHALTLRSDARTVLTAGETRLDYDAGGLGRSWERRLTGGVVSRLNLTDDTLYASTMAGRVEALRADDGDPLWITIVGGYARSSPLVAGGLVLVGSSEGSLHALRRQDGGHAWQAPTAGPVDASPAVVGNVVSVGSGDGSVYGVDLRSGERRWRYELPAGQGAFVRSPIATDGERFFFVALDGTLYSLDATTGELRWRRDADAYDLPGVEVEGGRLLVSGRGGGVASYDAKTGEPGWRLTTGSSATGLDFASLAGDLAFVGIGGARGEVRCLSTRSGRVRWSSATGHGIETAPILLGEVVVAASGNGQVTALARANGRILGRYRLPAGRLLARPVGRGGTVYVASLSEKIFGLSLGEKGEPVGG